MLFNSFPFVVFFPIVVLVYYLIPKKLRYIWLLIASYYFYMSWNAVYAILIAVSTLVTWLSGILLSTAENTGKKKGIVAGSLILNLGILFFFKYFDFTIDNINLILNKAGFTVLAFEAGKTLVMDLEDVIKLADKHKICLCAV